jgi:hypothetical protein
VPAFADGDRDDLRAALVAAGKLHGS